MKKLYARLAVLPLLVSAACVGSEKSANPLSPVIAGPIAGVAISAPTVVAPGGDALIDSRNQPITLQVGNAETNGVRPLSYRFEVATDPSFTNPVFAKDGVPQDATGRTNMTLPSPLAPERKYFWHARAEDGANTGPFGGTSAFNVFTPVVFGAPGLISPINDATTSSQPKFVIGNSTHSGPAGTISYYLEVATSASFAQIVAAWQFPETASQSELTAPSALAAGQYFWHVRAYDSAHNGPFSGSQSFRTSSSGGGGGGGVDCGGTYNEANAHACFLSWVSGLPFSQQTLVDLEQTKFKQYGWKLTPPNAVGDRTKIQPPGGPWIRVGFQDSPPGVGTWVWVVQS